MGRVRHDGSGWCGPAWKLVAAMISGGGWRDDIWGRWPRTEVILTDKERAGLRSTVAGGQRPQTRSVHGRARRESVVPAVIVERHEVHWRWDAPRL